MRANFKDVPVADVKYRVGRLTAADGSWVAVKMTEKLRETRQAEAKSLLATPTVATGEAQDAATAAAGLSFEDGMMMTASFLVEKFDRAQMAEVQLMCMQACSKMEPVGETLQPMPLIINGNQWSYPDMEYDGATVLQLTKEVLAFNIARFFPAAG